MPPLFFGSFLLGVAENVDRHNSVRTDMASVFTDEYALLFGQYLPSNDNDRFDEVATMLSNVGAHELGHILGLEHATESTFSPNNVMGYNENAEPQEFEVRNKYWYQGLGFTNEIDQLLRTIGSGTPMGS